MAHLVSVPTLQPAEPLRPRLPIDLVDRPRLKTRLDRAAEGKMTLVRAPAGYGKTTLLGSWLAAGERRTAWLALRGCADTLDAFVRALVVAVRAVVPDAGKDALALLNLPEPPEPALLATALAAELGTVAGPLVIVLDDYEQMRAEPIHELLAALLLRLPLNVHVVVASRALPSLPLPTLRAEGQITELGVDDLRFAPDEARAFFDRALAERLPARTVALLVERTEGWPAGLRLAAVLLRDRPDRDAVLATLADGSHAYIHDYLLNEMLAGEPPDVHHFLLRTSILDRFSAPLCDAVVELPAGASGEMLAGLLREGAMLVALDERGEWFRYHNLFEELLRRRLEEEAGPDEVAALHRRAAAWLAGAGAVVDAERHLLAAGDGEVAARLVEADVHPALNREEWSRVAAALDALPPEQLDTRPALLLARAWVLHFRGQVSAMPPLLELAESALAADPPDADTQARLRGELDTLWSEVWLRRGDLRAALAHAQRGGEHLAEEQLYARGVADGMLGVALHRRGHGREALRMYRTRAERETGSTAVYTARLLLIMAYCYLVEGRLDVLETRAWRVLALAREHRLPLTAAWVRHVLGRVLYEWDEPVRAAEQHAAVIERRDEAHFDAFRDSVFGLALAYQAQGQPGQAQDEIERLLRLMRDAGLSHQLDLIRAFEARLALMRGDAATWGRWLDANRESLTTESPDALIGFAAPMLTRAQALIALGDAASLSQAHDDLTALQRQYAAENNRSRLVTVFALQALTCQARDDQGSALAALERALATGRRGGFIRTFVDLGPQMARLISTLASQGRPSGYLRRLQAACMAVPSLAPPTSSALETRPGTPIEPLTWREQDVLQHLARRLSNKEIAASLDISPLTVKKHAESIYRKLHVSGRRDATRRARALGLLS